MYSDIPVFDIINKGKCCGCEACLNICPVSCIEMVGKDEGGFLYPQSDSEKCIHCNKCQKVCPALGGNDRPLILTSFGGYARDPIDVAKGSSGGVFGVIAESFSHAYDSWYICAVIWDEDFRGAHHICSHSCDDVENMKFSKYVQSRKSLIYREIKTKIDKGCNVLFVGTPCECWGLHNYLGKEFDNLYCIDFVCQGPTSPEAMRQFVDSIQRKFHSHISSLNMRHTIGRWIPQYIKIEFENGRELIRLFYKTSIGKALLYMQRPSCYSCEYNANRRASDITLGDFHGADETDSYYCEAGTSVVVVNTKKGQNLVEAAGDKLSLFPVPYDVIAKPNPRLIGSWSRRPGSSEFVKTFDKYGLKAANLLALYYRLKDKFRVAHRK